MIFKKSKKAMLPYFMLLKKAFGFIFMSLGGFIVWNAVNNQGITLQAFKSSWYAIPIVMFGLFVTWALIYKN